MIEHLKSLYKELPNGGIKRMIVRGGKELDYLGMNFNFQEKRKGNIHHV